MLKLSRKFLLHWKHLLACLIATRAQSPLNHSVSFSEHCYHLLFYSAPKVNTFDTHIFQEINTGLVTYPIDTCWRWRLTSMLSHIPHGWIQVPHSPMHTYTLHAAQNTSNKRHKIHWVFYIRIKYSHITIKHDRCRQMAWLSWSVFSSIYYSTLLAIFPIVLASHLSVLPFLAIVPAIWSLSSPLSWPCTSN